LLDLLSVEGAIVTIDAMGRQRVIALKGNQGTRPDDVEMFAREQKAVGFKDMPVSQDETVGGDHARIETRTVTVFQDVGLRKPTQGRG